MDSSSLVVKHNSLIRSRYDYTLAELKLVITIASMVEQTDEDFREYVVPAAEYARLMDADASNTRKTVKKLGKMLMSKPLFIPTEDGFAICNWFSWFQYANGEIRCSVHPKLKPYLLQLKEQFTRYRLENVLRFKSVYSVRIYELAKSWESKGKFEMSIDDLRKTLGLEEKYRLYGDLKKKVLIRSSKEISELSDITLSYREIKEGKRVVGLRFYILPKNKASSLEEFKALIRKNLANQTLYKGMAEKEDGSQTEVEIACSQKGRLYDKKTAEDLLPAKAERFWRWLFAQVKAGNIELEGVSV